MPVNLLIEGTINSARNTNPYNLSVGDSVFASASFDNNLITSAGSSEIGFGTNGNAFGGSLNLMIGSRNFNEQDDIDYFGFFPTLTFDNGLFSCIEFVSEFGRNSRRLFESFGLDFDRINQNNGRVQITGSWDISTLSITPTASVPEPTTMMLLGLGIMGLVGSKRRMFTKQ